MPSKYDTNPLDPEFPEKARAAAANGDATRVLEQGGARTQHFPPPAATEEQTRRFAAADTGPYAPPYTGQYVPAAYPTGGYPASDPKRKIPKIGLPEHIATAVPYFPFQIGLVAGILELLFVPKNETKVRFHAAQGLAAHFAILVITTILGALSDVARGAAIGNGIFTAATTVMLIIFAVKAWKGRPVHIAPIEDLTNWLEEKIGPLKSKQQS
jgi:uncharacterized membrane protein